VNIQKIRPTQDNVLVRFQLDDHVGVLIVDPGRTRSAKEAVQAEVVAAGPGHYHERARRHDEDGTIPDGSSVFVPMNPDLVPGARVLVEGHYCGDRLWSNEHVEYRMVRETNILGCIE